MEWIIGVCNSSCDGVILLRFEGDIEGVKRHLLSLVNEDRANEPEPFCEGTEGENEICENEDGSLYAFGNYMTYHIDYTAKSLADIRIVN